MRFNYAGEKRTNEITEDLLLRFKNDPNFAELGIIKALQLEEMGDLNLWGNFESFVKTYLMRVEEIYQPEQLEWTQWVKLSRETRIVVLRDVRKNPFDDPSYREFGPFFVGNDADFLRLMAHDINNPDENLVYVLYVPPKDKVVDQEKAPDYWKICWELDDTWTQIMREPVQNPNAGSLA